VVEGEVVGVDAVEVAEVRLTVPVGLLDELAHGRVVVTLGAQ